MIRESMDNGAYVQLGRIPTGSFSGYIWRTVAAGGTGGVPSFTGKIRWMRLIRQGNRVTAFHAADSGGNPGTWVQLGQPITIVMSTPVVVGFGVDNAGGTAGVLNVAQFTNLSIVPLNKAPIVAMAATATWPVSPVALNGSVTDDNFPTPVDLTSLWTSVSGPAPVLFGDAAQPATTATLSQHGDYVLRLAANDSSAHTFKDLAFTAYTSALQVWQAQNWAGGGGVSDPAAALLLDPDFDGQSNLLEFAFGMPPNANDTSPVVYDHATVGPDEFLRLSVPKNPAATDLSFTVEATSDLGNPASWTSAGLVIEIDTSTQLVVRDNMPLNNGQPRFMRVKVSLPP